MYCRNGGRGLRQSIIELLILVCASFAVAIIATLQWTIANKYIQQQQPPLTNSLEAPFIAIVSCIKSQGYDPAHSLESILLPSIHKTLTETERDTYRVELILGYDEDDPYWQHRQNQVEAVNKGNARGEKPIPVSFLSIRKQPDRENRIPFNELCQAAYDYGATYIVRVNDDTQFASTQWATLAIRTLQSYSPPNMGVVGPTCHEGNTEIMTHDMVHAPSHYQIFDTYYPDIFDNYYVDDWISRVYGDERTTMIEDWVVVHHLHMYGTRYHPTFHQDNFLNDTIKEGRSKIQTVLLSKLTTNGGDLNEEKMLQQQRRIELSTKLVRVDGPMSEFTHHNALELVKARDTLF